MPSQLIGRTLARDELLDCMVKVRRTYNRAADLGQIRREPEEFGERSRPVAEMSDGELANGITLIAHLYYAYAFGDEWTPEAYKTYRALRAVVRRTLGVTGAWSLTRVGEHAHVLYAVD